MNENLENTTEAILETLSSHLNTFAGMIFFLDEEEKNLQVHSFSKKHIIGKMVGTVPFDVFKIKYPVDLKPLLLGECIRKNKPVFSAELQKFLYPVFPNKTLLNAIQKIIRVKLCCAMPIRINQKPFGVLFAAFREKKLTRSKIAMLKFYANLSSIAIENNNKLNTVRGQYENEKQTTSILSHELRTPLSIAYNSAQLMDLSLAKMKSEMSEKAFRELSGKISDIQNSIQRIKRICNSIFSLREIESHIPDDVHKLDLGRQLEGIIANFERIAQTKGLTFKVNLDDNPQEYHGGIVQLEQIMTILLDNAMKYTEKGSVTASIKITGKTITATVTDTGSGIPAKERQKVFDRFYRHHQGIKKRTEGLGLGLYICKKIVDQIQGEINVGNNPSGKGTQFTVKIPVYDQSR